MIPDFDEDGLLPPGIHWATWAQITKRFGANNHRKKLLGGLDRGVQALRKACCPALYLDGSFVTAKLMPDDYDACYEMAGVKMPLLDPVLYDFSNLRAAQKAKYLGEFFLAYAKAEGPPLYRIYLNYFQQDDETGKPKGIIGLKL